MSTIGQNIYNAIQVWNPAVKRETEQKVSFLVEDNVVLGIRVVTVAAISFASAVWTSASWGLTGTAVTSSLVALPVAIFVSSVALAIFSYHMTRLHNKNSVEIFKNHSEIPAAVLTYLTVSGEAVGQLLREKEMDFKNNKSLKLFALTLFPFPPSLISVPFSLNTSEPLPFIHGPRYARLEVFKMLMRKYQHQLHASQLVDLSKLNLQGDTAFDAILNLPDSHEKITLFKQVVSVLNQSGLLTQDEFGKNLKYSILMKAAEQTNAFFLHHLREIKWLEECLPAGKVNLFSNAENPPTVNKKSPINTQIEFKERLTNYLSMA